MAETHSKSSRAGALQAVTTTGKRALWSVVRRSPVWLQEWVIRARLRDGGAVGDPLAIRWVDPADVGLMISRTEFGDQSVGRVVGGDWDRRAYPFETNEVYGLFAEHFRDGVPWDETAGYRKHVSRLERGERLGLLDTDDQTVECYRAYLAYWDGVYSDIERNGYRTQRELNRRDDFLARPTSAGGEINVYVGRDGQLICRSGKHRLTIAKLLGLDRVPVRVMVRHADWQALREAIAAAKSAATLDELAPFPSDHPDLQDVLGADASASPLTVPSVR